MIVSTPLSVEGIGVLLAMAEGFRRLPYVNLNIPKIYNLWLIKQTDLITSLCVQTSRFYIQINILTRYNIGCFSTVSYIKEILKPRIV